MKGDNPMEQPPLTNEQIADLLKEHMESTCSVCAGTGYHAEVIRGRTGLDAWARMRVPEAAIRWCDCEYTEPARNTYRAMLSDAWDDYIYHHYLNELDRSGVPERFRDLHHETLLTAPYEVQTGKILGLAVAMMFGEHGRVNVGGLPYYIPNEHLEKMAKENPGTSQAGMLLTGHTGTGKSVMAAIALRNRIRNSKQGLWIHWQSWLLKVQGGYGRRDENGVSEADKLIGQATSADVLVIDDLGDSEWKGQLSDDKQRLLWLVISERHSRNMETIITTNLSLDREKGFAACLREQLWKKTVDRLVELCLMVRVNGCNLRDKELS